MQFTYNHNFSLSHDFRHFCINSLAVCHLLFTVNRFSVRPDSRYMTVESAIWQFIDRQIREIWRWIPSLGSTCSLSVVILAALSCVVFCTIGRALSKTKRKILRRHFKFKFNEFKMMNSMLYRLT